MQAIFDEYIGREDVHGWRNEEKNVSRDLAKSRNRNSASAIVRKNWKNTTIAEFLLI
jgi:hypothetical protein